MKASVMTLFAGAAVASAAALNTTVPYTTSTVYSTRTSTISECAVTVTDCPYRTHPVTTVIVDTYTTYCPVAQSSSAPWTSVAPPATWTPAPSGSVPSGGAPGKSSPGSGATATWTSKPASNTTVPVTGGANAQKAGGLLMAVGIAAAFL